LDNNFLLTQRTIALLRDVSIALIYNLSGSIDYLFIIQYYDKSYKWKKSFV